MKSIDSSKLDRRRDAARAAQEAADEAARRLSRIDDQLAANHAQTQENETALRRAGDEVTRRKKALKAAAKKDQQLAAARKKATAAAAKAQQKARTAVEKYDRAVLAGLVRRERARDLAEHDGTTPDPQPEVAGLAGSTATETAARKTAATADDPANQGADGPH